VEITLIFGDGRVEAANDQILVEKDRRDAGGVEDVAQGRCRLWSRQPDDAWPCGALANDQRSISCASQPATGTLEFGLREMARQIATYYPIAVEALP
jgi:hypothetical protein